MSGLKFALSNVTLFQPDSLSGLKKKFRPEDMLNFEFLEKSLELVSPPHFVYDFLEKYFSCHILVTDQISLSDYLCFLGYWVICVLQLFVSQLIMS